MGEEAPAFPSLGFSSDATPKFNTMKCRKENCAEEGDVQTAGLL